MRLSLLLLSAGLLLPAAPASAQMDPGAVAGGEAARYDAERRARIARGLPPETPQTPYERWRNRPGKRDCGAYNRKCPAKARSDAAGSRASAQSNP